MDKQVNKSRPAVYDVTCGDDTTGRISAQSAEEAREMADEMCQVHDVVQSGRDKAARKGHES